MALTTKPELKYPSIDTVRASAKTIAITPSDTNYLADASDNPLFTRGIIVSADGNLVVEFANDPAGTYRTIAVLAGVVYPFCVSMVRTSSTATGIIGLL